MKVNRTIAKFLSASAAAAALAALAPSQITTTGGKTLLRYKFKAGTTYSFTMASTMTAPASLGGSGKPVTIQTPFAFKVLKTTGGTATIEVTGSRPTMGSGGQTQKQSFTIDTMGRPVGQSSLPTGINTPFPEKAVKVGDTWKGTMPVNVPGMPTLTLKATYRFLGIKTVDGKSVAAVAFTNSMDSAGGPRSLSVNGSGTMNFQVTDGFLLSGDLLQNVTLKMEGGKPIKVPATSTIRRGQ